MKGVPTNLQLNYLNNVYSEQMSPLLKQYGDSEDTAVKKKLLERIEKIISTVVGLSDPKKSEHSKKANEVLQSLRTAIAKIGDSQLDQMMESVTAALQQKSQNIVSNRPRPKVVRIELLDKKAMYDTELDPVISAKHKLQSIIESEKKVYTKSCLNKKLRTQNKCKAHITELYEPEYAKKESYGKDVEWVYNFFVKEKKMPTKDEFDNASQERSEIVVKNDDTSKEEFDKQFDDQLKQGGLDDLDSLFEKADDNLDSAFELFKESRDNLDVFKDEDGQLSSTMSDEYLTKVLNEAKAPGDQLLQKIQGKLVSLRYLRTNGEPGIELQKYVDAKLLNDADKKYPEYKNWSKEYKIYAKIVSDLADENLIERKDTQKYYNMFWDGGFDVNSAQYKKIVEKMGEAGIAKRGLFDQKAVTSVEAVKYEGGVVSGIEAIDTYQKQVKTATEIMIFLEYAKSIDGFDYDKKIMRDMDGESCSMIDYAIEYNMHDIVQVLKNLGAKSTREYQLPISSDKTLAEYQKIVLRDSQNAQEEIAREIATPVHLKMKAHDVSPDPKAADLATFEHSPERVAPKGALSGAKEEGKKKEKKSVGFKLPYEEPASSTVPAAENLQVEQQVVRREKAASSSAPSPVLPPNDAIQPFKVNFADEQGKTISAKRQAQQIIERFEEEFEKGKDKKVAITYSANSKQADDIYRGYQTGDFSIHGGNQAQVIKLVIEEIHKRKWEDKAHILPVATMSYDKKHNKQPVDKKSVKRDLDNIAQHVGAGWTVLGFQNQTTKPGELAVGGAISKEVWDEQKGLIREEKNKDYFDASMKKMLQGDYSGFEKSYNKGKENGVPTIDPLMAPVSKRTRAKTVVKGVLAGMRNRLKQARHSEQVSVAAAPVPQQPEAGAPKTQREKDINAEIAALNEWIKPNEEIEGGVSRLQYSISNHEETITQLREIISTGTYEEGESEESLNHEIQEHLKDVEKLKAQIIEIPKAIERLANLNAANPNEVSIISLSNKSDKNNIDLLFKQLSEALKNPNLSENDTRVLNDLVGKIGGVKDNLQNNNEFEVNVYIFKSELARLSQLGISTNLLGAKPLTPSQQAPHPVKPVNDAPSPHVKLPTFPPVAATETAAGQPSIVPTPTDAQRAALVKPQGPPPTPSASSVLQDEIKTKWSLQDDVYHSPPMSSGDLNKLVEKGLKNFEFERVGSTDKFIAKAPVSMVAELTQPTTAAPANPALAGLQRPPPLVTMRKHAASSASSSAGSSTLAQTPIVQDDNQRKTGPVHK